MREMIEIGDQVLVRHYDDKTSSNAVVVDYDISVQHGMQFLVKFNSDGFTTSYPSSRLMKAGN